MSLLLGPWHFKDRSRGGGGVEGSGRAAQQAGAASQGERLLGVLLKAGFPPAVSHPGLGGGWSPPVLPGEELRLQGQPVRLRVASGDAVL